MRLNTLLSPGRLANGVMLRTEAAKAISSVEVTAGRTPGGKTIAAADLAAFFTDCASKLSSLADNTAPTISSRVATSATLVTITFSETMDQTVVPPASAFASAGNTIGVVAWTSGTTLTVTGTGFASGEAFGYTKPAASYLRDRAGNAVATSSANLT